MNIINWIRDNKSLRIKKIIITSYLYKNSDVFIIIEYLGVFIHLQQKNFFCPVVYTILKKIKKLDIVPNYVLEI